MSEKSSITLATIDEQARYLEERVLSGDIDVEFKDLLMIATGVSQDIADLVWSQLFSMRKHGHKYEDRRSGIGGET